jgi:hypothetical protein
MVVGGRVLAGRWEPRIGSFSVASSTRIRFCSSLCGSCGQPPAVHPRQHGRCRVLQETQDREEIIERVARRGGRAGRSCARWPAHRGDTADRAGGTCPHGSGDPRALRSSAGPAIHTRCVTDGARRYAAHGASSVGRAMRTATRIATGTNQGAHRMKVNALIRVRAAYRNRTDDLFITSSGTSSSATSAKVRPTSSNDGWRTWADPRVSRLTWS